MKKFFLISTAVYFFFLGFMILVFGTIGIIAILAEPSKQSVNLLYAIMPLLLMIIWLVSTGVGLLMKKNWSRYSVIVMSVLAILIGIINTLMFSLVPLSDSASQVPYEMAIRLFILSPIVLLLIVLPVIYIVFFTRKTVKEMFTAGGHEESSINRPVGITILAIVQLISGICTLIGLPAFANTPISIFGFLITGLPVMIYEIVVVALCFYIAYGFWKMQKGAWIAAVVLYSIGTMIILYNMIVGYPQAYLAAMPQVYGPYLQTVLKVQAGISGAIGVLILTYVLSKRDKFFSVEAPKSENKIEG